MTILFRLVSVDNVRLNNVHFRMRVETRLCAVWVETRLCVVWVETRLCAVWVETRLCAVWVETLLCAVQASIPLDYQVLLTDLKILNV